MQWRTPMGMQAVRACSQSLENQQDTEKAIEVEGTSCGPFIKTKQNKTNKQTNKKTPKTSNWLWTEILLQKVEGATANPVNCSLVKCLLGEMVSSQPIKNNWESSDNFQESHSVAFHRSMIRVLGANSGRPLNKEWEMVARYGSYFADLKKKQQQNPDVNLHLKEKIKMKNARVTSPLRSHLLSWGLVETLELYLFSP